MKNLSLIEALAILKKHITDYQQTCKDSSGKIRSDIYTLFSSGETGFKRSNDFLAAIQKAQQQSKITSPESLLDFIILYKDKGKKLNTHIFSALREIVGFNEAHITYIVPLYQRANEVQVHGMLHVPPEDLSREKIIEYINEAICGSYNEDLLKCFPKNAGGIKASQLNTDFGLQLLNYLDNKAHKANFELENMQSTVISDEENEILSRSSPLKP